MKRAPKKPPISDRRSLKLPNSNEWDWERVTDELCDWLIQGHARSTFAARSDTPGLTAILTNIGMNEERSARVRLAYRFRAEAAADDIIELRRDVLNKAVAPREAQVALNSLHRELDTMTALSTKAPPAKPPSSAANTRSLGERIEQAKERANDAAGEDN